MNEVFTKSTLPKLARIRLDVPLGTSYLEIQASIFHQAWSLAGTQLRAAVALGITPDTISRVLRRCDRLGIGCPTVPEACPLVDDRWVNGPSSRRTIDRENRKPDQVSSNDRVSDRANPSSVSLTRISDNAEEQIDSPSNLGDEADGNDL